MKKNIIFLLVIFISLFANPQHLYGAATVAVTAVAEHSTALIAATPSVVQLNFRLAKLEREQITVGGEQFDRFAFEGHPIAGGEGWPELPALTSFLLIPPQSGVELNLENLRSHKITDVNPFPVQTELMTGDESVMFEPGAENWTKPLKRVDIVNETDGFWPPEPVTLGKPAIMRGYRILPVTVYPLRWNARTGELVVLDNVDIEVNFATDKNRENIVIDPDRPRPSRYFHQLVSNIALNPPLPQRDPGGPRGGSVVYVIDDDQSWNEVANTLAPLVEWRRRMGWTAQILRVRTSNDAASVTRELQQAYREWTIPPEIVIICGDTDGSFPFGFFDKNVSGLGYPYESDNDFCLWEGDDVLPEAAVSRMPFDSIDRLRGMVNKFIRYESDPYVPAEGNQRNWQKRGAVVSHDYRSGLSSIDMCRWTRSILLNNGYQQVSQLYFSAGQIADTRQFTIDNFEGGMSMFLFRGHLWMGQQGDRFTFAMVPQLRNDRMLPYAMIITCNTGDYAEHISDGGNGYFNESFTWHPNGGAIGAVGSAGSTHTAYNNIYCSASIHSIFAQNLTLMGYVHLIGKLGLYTHYAGRGDVNHPENRNMLNWLCHYYITNLMGDGAVDLFTDVPQPLLVHRPEVLRRGETHLAVEVMFDRDEDVPAQGIDVCLYKAEQNAPVFQIVKQTDAEGRVQFDLNPQWTQSGQIKLTVSGHNLRPVLVDYNITPAPFIGAGTFTINDDNEGDSRGDGDNRANPTETLELALNITNYGGRPPQGEMIAELTTDSPYLEVISGQAFFNVAPDSAASVRGDFVVLIGGGMRHNQNAVFNLTTTAGGQSWNSSVSIPVVGPKFGKPRLLWDNAPLRPADAASLRISLVNIGGKAAPPMAAALFSRTHTIGAPVADGTFRAAGVNDTARSEGSFRLSAHPFHLGGQKADLGIALASDGGILDTVWFTIVVDEPRPGQPFGPDKYGYICFDDTDTSWFAAPRFEWVEISGRLNGPGTNTTLNDIAAEDDSSVVVNLPFNFQYYGQNFNRITICTNGWIAMGDYRHLISARNRHIPDGENPPGMIAPFWDDLITDNNSGIWTWYDEDNNRFIVEWSRMKRLGGNPQTIESFQVILNDPRHYPSFTGDGEIIFQYLDVTDEQQCNQAWDTPFASVGIASPDLSTGLEYTYWNQRNGAAAPLVPRRAIKFTTLIEFVTGCLRGYVTDFETGEALQSALITTTYGFSARTDAEGFYEIPEILVDTNYTITASKQFYNDSTQTGIVIIEGDPVYVDFALLHPEFTMSVDSVYFEMLPDSVAQRAITMRNNGNGTLWFNTRLNYVPSENLLPPPIWQRLSSPVRDEPDEAWDPLLMFTVSDTVGDAAIQCIELVDTVWYVAGSNNRNDTLRFFYRFDRRGRYIDRLPQPRIGGQYGIRDMVYYEDMLYCALGNTWIALVDPISGDSIAGWTMPIRNFSPRNITIDPETGLLYLSTNTSSSFIQVFSIDVDTLRPVRSYAKLDPRTNEAIREQGLAWFKDDIDRFYLYLITNVVPTPNDPNRADVSIHKLNTETGEIRFLTDLGAHLPASASGRGGMTITSKWNNLVWVLAAVFDNNQQDLVGVFEIGPNSSWMRYEPKLDTLVAGTARPIEFTINSADLDYGFYGVTINFSHNANPGLFSLPIILEVTDSLTPPPPDTDTVVNTREKELFAKYFALKQNHPNPFNMQTRLVYSLDRTAKVSLTIWDTNGREVARLIDKVQKDGRYEYIWRADDLPAGIYFARLQSGDKVAVRKMAVLK